MAAVASHPARVSPELPAAISSRLSTESTDSQNWKDREMGVGSKKTVRPCLGCQVALAIEAGEQ